jgi:hypothetical protein
MLTYLCWHICDRLYVLCIYARSYGSRARISLDSRTGYILYTILLLNTTHTPLMGNSPLILETHLCQASVLQPTCSFNNKTSYIKCPLCLVMATTRPRDHCAMATRPPTRAADPSSALHVVPLPQHPSDGHHVVWRPLRGHPAPALYVV